MILTPEELALLRRIAWQFGEFILFAVLVVLLAMWVIWWWFHCKLCAARIAKAMKEMLEEHDKK